MVSFELERLLRAGVEATPGAVFRDAEGRLLLATADAIDGARLAERSLASVARRFRVRAAGGGVEQVFLAPRELARLASDDARGAAGVVLPIGMTVHDGAGLYIRYARGIEHVGVNDRGDVVLRRRAPDEAPADAGPVIGSVRAGERARSPAPRVIVRSPEEHALDLAEARAWLAAADVVGERTFRRAYLSMGVDGLAIGDAPLADRGVELAFFDPEDPEAVALRDELRRRSERAGAGRVPRVQTWALAGLPADEAGFDAFCERVRARGGVPADIGLPGRLAASRFWDEEAGAIAEAIVVARADGEALPEVVSIIAVEPARFATLLASAMPACLAEATARVGGALARASAAVIGHDDAATVIVGPPADGRFEAAAFWANEGDATRRGELARRLGALLGDADAGEAAAAQAGLLCQADRVALLPGEEGDDAGWVFWPTQRHIYVRAAVLPELLRVLVERAPTIEDAAADFGASGDASAIGAVTHRFARERVFYDPEWGVLRHDRCPRALAAVVFLGEAPDDADDVAGLRVARLDADDVARRVLADLDAPADLVAALAASGLAGERLVAAWERARAGEPGALAGGDAERGAALLRRLDGLLGPWRACASAVPTFAVEGAARGADIMHDAIWLVSEQPDRCPPGEALDRDRIARIMEADLGVGYDDRGRWSHIAPEGRESNSNEESFACQPST